MFQAWNVGDITNEALNLENWITGVILAVVVAMVILGGIKRIGSVASVLVPFMCVLYVLIALAVLVMNLDTIPAVFGLIFRTAFNPADAGGAFIGGSVGMAFLWGMKRALFSSEAGQGSSPIAHSAAQTKEPVSESVVAGLEPFIDTIVVCTLTALVILCTGALERGDGIEGADGQLASNVAVSEHDGEWTVGTPTEFTIDGSTSIMGRTELPERTEHGAAMGGEWRNGDSVFTIAEGGALNEDTNSNRIRMSGTVVIPEESSSTPYIRWQKVSVASWDALAEQGEAPTLFEPMLYENYMGATFTAYAINRQFPGIGTWLILIASWLFAISTMISWSYYGEQGVVYLFGSSVVPFYKIIYCILIVIATLPIVSTATEIGNLTDLGTGIMLWVNIPIMLIFGFIAMKAYHSYFKRLKNGEIKRTAGGA